MAINQAYSAQKPSKKKLIILGVIGLVLLSTGIGYWRYQESQKDEIISEIRTPEDLDKLGEQSSKVADDAAKLEEQAKDL